MAHSQTAAFLRSVREHMQAPPVVVPGELPALETVARMTEARASAAVIVADDGRVAGILTEQDVTRRIEAADLVTEMKEIKHPFHAGIYAQQGIEF